MMTRDVTNRVTNATSSTMAAIQRGHSPKRDTMRPRTPVLVLILSAVAPAVLFGQTGQQPAATPASTVLTVFRESVKVGKGGAHDDLENAWAAAVAAAKAPPFIAMAAVTGPAETWYLASFTNWSEYEKSTDASNSSPALAAIDKKFRAQEDEYLSDARLMTLRVRPELGYGPPADLANMRYVSVTRISVRPGHNGEFDELRKTITAAHQSAKMTDQYSIWQATNGAPAGTYYLFVSRKSLGEIEEGAALHNGAAYLAALGGPEGQKKLDALAAGAILSQQTDLFEFKPGQSVPPEEWIKANPNMWQRKPPAVKKTAPEVKK
jgi:hypothetical protein